MKKKSAFTVVELLIGVGIVALLSAIAVPGYIQARHYAQRTGFAAELRKTVEAFQMYASENNRLPDTLPLSKVIQNVPDGMSAYMPKNSTWESSPKIGGYWGWINLDTPLRGYDGAIIFLGIQATAEQMQELDARLDNGELNTGSFQYDANSNLIFYGMN